MVVMLVPLLDVVEGSENPDSGDSLLQEKLLRSMLLMEAFSFLRCSRISRSLISIKTFKTLIRMVGITLIRIFGKTFSLVKYYSVWSQISNPNQRGAKTD